MADGKLSGKVVVVTGAGRGLGRSMSLALAEQGALLALVDMDGEELQQVAGEIEQIAADLAGPDLLEAVELS